MSANDTSIFAPGNITFSKIWQDNISTGNAAPAASPAADDYYSVYHPYTRTQVRNAFYVIYICYPILLLLCTVGNTLTLFVLAHTKHKGSTNTYMMAVAVANLFILWLYMPTYIFQLVSKKDWAGTFLFHFYQFFGLQQWLNDTFIHLSDWTLIVFSLERLLAVTNPFLFRKLKGDAYPRVIVVALLLLGGTASFFVVYDYYAFTYPNTHVRKALNLPEYEQSDTYKEWDRIQKAAEVAIFIGQFFALLILNTLIAIVVTRINKFDVGSKSGGRKNASQQQRNSVLLLLGSVVLYLITQFPTLIHLILKIAQSYEMFQYDAGPETVTKPSILMAQYINYAANFLIYMTVSQQFRAQVSDVFGQYRCGRWFKAQKKKYFPQKQPSPSAKPTKTTTYTQRKVPVKRPFSISERLSGLKRAEAIAESRRGSVDSVASDVSNVDIESRPASAQQSRKVSMKMSPGTTVVGFAEYARRMDDRRVGVSSESTDTSASGASGIEMEDMTVIEQPDGERPNVSRQITLQEQTKQPIEGDLEKGHDRTSNVHSEHGEVSTPRLVRRLSKPDVPQSAEHAGGSNHDGSLREIPRSTASPTENTTSAGEVRRGSQDSLQQSKEEISGPKINQQELPAYPTDDTRTTNQKLVLENINDSPKDRGNDNSAVQNGVEILPEAKRLISPVPLPDEAITQL